jgi:ABC-type Fe3+ transport system permease subunit
LAISGARLTYRWHVVLSWQRRRSVVWRAFWPSIVCAILFVLLAVGIIVLGGTAATPVELLRELFG